MRDQVVIYKPEYTARMFHNSNAMVRGIMGNYGSGKSTACVMDIWLKCMQQTPWNGSRRSRWAIIRSTYSELESTTLKTFLQWIPEFTPDGKAFCVVNRQRPIIARVLHPAGDGTIIDAEFDFLALDKPEDTRKLRSLEVTGGWINEAKEVPKEVLDDLQPRCGRWPPKDAEGCLWHGVIMDTNPPDDDHWYFDLAEVKRPKNMAFFKQPPAILKVPSKQKDGPSEYVPNRGQGPYTPAENVEHIIGGYDYWLNLVGGKDEEWIKVYLMGQYGSVMTGKPVFPEYVDDVHCTKKDIEVEYGLPIVIGMDFGRTPCAIISQTSNYGQLRCIDELVSEDMGIRTFARDFLKPHMRNRYSNMPYRCVVDPAGNTKAQTEEHTCIQILQEEGINVEMAVTNEIRARLEGVKKLLTRMTNGQPGLIISPKCKILRKAMLGGYHYRRMRIGGATAKYADLPEKNHPFSDVADSLEYICGDVDSGGFYNMAGRSGIIGGSVKARSITPVDNSAWD